MRRGMTLERPFNHTRADMNITLAKPFDPTETGRGMILCFETKEKCS
jgi:hypothetical protein